MTQRANELACSIAEQASVFQCLLSDVVKASEHLAKDNILASESFKKNSLARDGHYDRVLESIRSGNSPEANKLADQSEDFFAKCLKDAIYSIHFAFAKKMSKSTGRTTTAKHGYLVSLAFNPSLRNSEKKDQMVARFIVAHEIGHIILHDDGIKPLDTGSTNKPQKYDEKEHEADQFAISILSKCAQWKDPFSDAIYVADHKDIEAIAKEIRSIGY